MEKRGRRLASHRRGKEVYLEKNRSDADLIARRRHASHSPPIATCSLCELVCPHSRWPLGGLTATRLALTHSTTARLALAHSTAACLAPSWGLLCLIGCLVWTIDVPPMKLARRERPLAPACFISSRPMWPCASRSKELRHASPPQRTTIEKTLLRWA
jgi:hypothetical protein